jgi:DNA-binding NtrC family response regulator
MAKNVILCVDDEKIILNSLKVQLKEEFGNDYSYETAENAIDAEELIDEMVEEGCKILVIVSDWLMPGIKGDEFLIKIHKKYPQIVKIMLSGHASEDAIEKAFKEANLHKCLSKPWSGEELIQTIKEGLEKI